MVMGFNAIVTAPRPQLSELKKKQQNQVTLFKLFLCDILNPFTGRFLKRKYVNRFKKS